MNMKKRSRILTILGIILLVFVIGIGYFIYRTEYKKTLICSSAKEQYRLDIYQLGEPDFPFGKSDCRLVLLKDNNKVDSIDVSVKNDGKQLYEDNFTVKWEDDRVSVTVHGEEQEDMTYVLF